MMIKRRSTFLFLAFWFHRRFSSSPLEHFWVIYWASARWCIHLYSCSYKNENFTALLFFALCRLVLILVIMQALLAFRTLSSISVFEVSGYSFNSVCCRGAVFKAHATVALVVLQCLDATRGYAVYTDSMYSYLHIIHKGFLFVRVFELRITLKGKWDLK